MPSKKKRRRESERPTIHPRNKYAENPPDFSLLASLYPSFQPFVFYTRDGLPRIDWTDFNATRELTRVLLLQDHGIQWWIPDGQLCPTVPNRCNYIHWIEDLLVSEIIAKTNTSANNARGFDIGTGANCIYPLLGASLLGWSFVGSDITNIALEWAAKNVKNNPQISPLVEIRKVENCPHSSSVADQHGDASVFCESIAELSSSVVREEADPLLAASCDLHADVKKRYQGPPVLLGVVKDGEKFDFCMCNPPFFETMEEAGLNPKTSCGGTPEEMICPGGERAFIIRIIEDSAVLKQSFRWYTSMVGRKSNLKFLISKLWEVGVTIVKTTEFVQGKTCRWGLAWSFVPPTRKMISPRVAQKNIISFMLEGLPRQFSAIHVLQSVESFFCTSGGSCELNASSFMVDITLSNDLCNAIMKNESQPLAEATSCRHLPETSNSSPLDSLGFRILVFQQIPGTLLVKGSLQNRDNPASGSFVLTSIFYKSEFYCRKKGSYSSVYSWSEVFHLVKDSGNIWFNSSYSQQYSSFIKTALHMSILINNSNIRGSLEI